MPRIMAIPALALLVGCIDTDTAIFVDPALEAASVSVTDGPLGAALSGGFDVVLHLGARASGPSETAFVSFSIKSSDESEVIVESLPVKTSTGLPVTVEPGGDDVVVSFEIDQEGDVIASELVDSLCAGQVVITVVIDDSLATTSTPVTSEPLSVSGCP